MFDTRIYFSTRNTCISPLSHFRLAQRMKLPFKCLAVCLELRKLSDVEVKEKYQVEISNRFAASENVDKSLDISSAWESV